MELVIKLDDETYKQAINRTEFDTLSLGIKVIEAVQNGRPLPKGHGDLIDTEKLKKAFIAWSMVVHGNFTDADIANIICKSSPIIKADKKYEAKVIIRGNCMICGKKLTEGLFFCKECKNKADGESEDKE